MAIEEAARHEGIAGTNRVDHFGWETRYQRDVSGWPDGHSATGAESVITARPSPVLLDPTPGQLDWIGRTLAGATAGSLGQELEVLVTCLDDAAPPPDHTQPWLHLAPVRVGIGDHGRPYVDVVGDPRRNVMHPVEQHFRA